MKILLAITLSLSVSFALQMPKTMQANFVQTVTNEHDQSLKYEGEIYYNAPYESKWIYTSPSPKTICVTQENITIIEDDLEQVTIYKNHNHIDFNQIYSDAILIEENKYITYFQDERYYLTTKENKIDSLSFTDALGNHSLIEFVNVLYDETLPSLGCHIPAHFDLIVE